MDCDVYICKCFNVVLQSGTNMNTSHEGLERMTNVPVSAMMVKEVVLLDSAIIAVGGKTLSHTPGACEYVGDPVEAAVPDQEGSDGPFEDLRAQRR